MQDSHSPCVSIGMPVFNAEKYVREAIDSLLAQTFADFELIISDNASTDATQEICLEYASKDSRIKYHRNQTQLGATRNFNQVFEMARGKYFKWAAHDDACAPEYLEQCVEVLDNEPDVVLCYSKTNLIDAWGADLNCIYNDDLNIRSAKPHERFHQLLETYGWYHANQIFGLIRTNTLKMTLLHGNYPHSDRVLLAELALKGEFCEIPQYLFLRRVHPQTSRQAHVTDATLAVWFDPRNKGKIVLPQLRRYFEFCRIVWRTKLPIDEKLRCYIQILRRLVVSPGLFRRLRLIVQESVKGGASFAVRALALTKSTEVNTTNDVPNASPTYNIHQKSML